MSKPKVLISSTCRDLGNLRTIVEDAIRGLNLRPIRSDSNDILFDPDEHTHQSCVRAVDDCDIVVFVLGGRYGGESIPAARNLIEVLDKSIRIRSSRDTEFLKAFDAGEVSITQLEILRAFELGIPVLTFISKELLVQHEIYLKNPDYRDKTIFPAIQKQDTAQYIFSFFDYIRKRQYNNLFFDYTDGKDLKAILRKQLSLLFRQLLKERRESNRHRLDSVSYVKAEIVSHTSGERQNAFDELFSAVQPGDTIKILGTGVTKFLGQDDRVEGLLRDGHTIEILLVNDQIVKKDWACTSSEFIDRLNTAFRNNSGGAIDELRTKTLCPLADLNFLIDMNHFNKYYQRPDYVKKVSGSTEVIFEYSHKIGKHGWSGSLDARHFQSFVPMSITAIVPAASNKRKLLAEFIVPFTEQRIILKSSLQENPHIYELFLEFFSETWQRGIPIV